MKKWTMDFSSGGYMGQRMGIKIDGDTLIDALGSPAFAGGLRHQRIGNCAGYQLIEVSVDKCQPNTTIAGATFANVFATACGMPLAHKQGEALYPTKVCIGQVFCSPEDMPEDVIIWKRTTPISTRD